MYLILAVMLAGLCAIHAVPLWAPTLCVGLMTLTTRRFNLPMLVGLLIGAAVCYPPYPLVTLLCAGVLVRHVTCTRL
jgi:hypothetical protein